MTTINRNFYSVIEEGPGNAWSSPSNATSTTDGGYASATVDPNFGTRYLRFTGWTSFMPIASDQKVDGIEVLVTLSSYHPSFNVQLVNVTGTAVGPIKSVAASNVGGERVTIGFGSSSDLWSDAISQADLRAGNFKVRLWAPKATTQSIFIDSVTVSLTHSLIPVPINSPTLNLIQSMLDASPTVSVTSDSLAYSMSLVTPEVIGNEAINAPSLTLSQLLSEPWVGKGNPAMSPRLNIKQTSLDVQLRYGNYDVLTNLMPANGQVWNTAWVTDNRGIVNDGTYVQWQTTSGASGYRVLNPFGTLPPDVDPMSLVVGIEVQVKRKAQNLDSYLVTKDEAAVLQRNYQDFGPNQIKTQAWSETDEVVSYGFKHDRWNLPEGTLISDLQEPGFGFRIDSLWQRTGGSGTPIQYSYVDAISFNLTYDSSHVASPGNTIQWQQQLQVPQTPTNVQPGNLAEEQSLKTPKTNTQVRPDRLAIVQVHQVAKTQTQVRSPRRSFSCLFRTPKTQTQAQIPTYQYVQASLEPDLVTSLDVQVSSFNLVYQDTKIDVIQDATTLNMTLVSDVYLDQVLDVANTNLTTVFSDTPVDQTKPVQTLDIVLTGQTGIDYVYDVTTQNLNLTYSEATPTGEALPMDLTFRMFEVNATSEYRVDSLAIATDQSNVYLDQGFKVDTQNLAIDFTDPQNDTIFDVSSANFNFGSTEVLKDTSYNLVTWLMNLTTTDTKYDALLDVTTQNLNLTTTDTKYDLINDLAALEAMIEYQDVNASQDFDVTNYSYDSTWPDTKVDYVFDAETMSLGLTSKTAIDYIEDIVTQNLNLISPEVNVVGILAFWYVIEHFEEFKETQEDMFVLQVSESELTPIRIFDLEYIEVEDDEPEVIYVEE